MIAVDERPVADRIEGIPHPGEATKVIGHEQACTRFVETYASGRMHHAWLVSGPRGIGKATLAFGFAKHVLAYGNPVDAPAAFDTSKLPETLHRQVAQGGHPELLHLTRPWDEKDKRFKSQLSIDEIRRTQSFYGMTAGAGGWRITIVDAADDMNASAANALLKILEEPPNRSLFFVLSHAPGRLLPTIRSRCQALQLQPLRQEQVLAVLDRFETGLPQAELARAAELSEGSVRRAVQLALGSVLDAYEQFENLMSGAGRGHAEDWINVHKIADSLARRGAEDSHRLFVDMVLGWIGSQVRKNSQTTERSALAGWAEVWEKANLSVRQAETFNLDRKQVILSLFAALFDRYKKHT